MKVILIQDVPNVGEEGDICDVKDGFGRNYLIPRKLAITHNKANLSMIEQKRKAIETRKEEKRKQALSLKERLEGEEITLEMPAGESGKLFGSVNSATVAEALEKKGINIERKRIDIPGNTIKDIGEYDARVKLYDEEAANIKIIVKRVEE